jgi:hypothetical protein
MLFVQFSSSYRRPEFAWRRSVRKMWWASAVVAGGIILFGTAPAQADPLLPGTADAQEQTNNALNYVLNKTNGMVVSTEDPMGPGSPVRLQAGDNQTGLPAALPRENAGAPGPDLPAADVVGGALARPAGGAGARPIGNLPIRRLPIGTLDLIGGGLPLLGGLLPDGGTPSLAARPTTWQAESFDGGLPLLGGLGGVAPVNSLPRSLPGTDVPDVAGLPGGGLLVVDPAKAPGRPAAPSAAPTAVAPAAAPGAPGSSASSTPTASSSAPTAASSASPPDSVARPVTSATPDDPRLHEEPVDGEASHRRAFTADGRPVAGVDQQYR